LSNYLPVVCLLCNLQLHCSAHESLPVSLAWWLCQCAGSYLIFQKIAVPLKHLEWAVWSWRWRHCDSVKCW